MRALGIISNVVNLQDGTIPKPYQATHLITDLAKSIGPRKLLELKNAFGVMMDQLKQQSI
jgi:hypothetical protein